MNASEPVRRAADRAEAAGRNLRAADDGRLPTEATIANARTLLVAALELLDGCQ